MPVNSLIVLARLREERRLKISDIAESIQQSEMDARKTVEKLVESGLIEAHGSGRGRSYTLSARIYRARGQKADYIRQVGFESIQQEQMVMQYIEKHGHIKRAEVIELYRITKDQAAKLLQKLKRSHKIVMKGQKKGAYYELPKMDL